MEEMWKGIHTSYTYLMDVGLRKAPCVSCYYALPVFLAETILLSLVSRFIQEAELTQI